MLTIIETPEFQKQAAKVWSEAERMDFICWLAEIEVPICFGGGAILLSLGLGPIEPLRRRFAIAAGTGLMAAFGFNVIYSAYQCMTVSYERFFPIGGFGIINAYLYSSSYGFDFPVGLIYGLPDFLLVYAVCIACSFQIRSLIICRTKHADVARIVPWLIIGLMILSASSMFYLPINQVKHYGNMVAMPPFAGPIGLAVIAVPALSIYSIWADRIMSQVRRRA